MITSFTPACGGVVACTGDRSVTVNYTIRVFNGPGFTPPPGLGSINAINNSNTTKLSLINSVLQSCGVNQTMTGINTDGSPICIAVGQTFSNISCPVNRVLRGFSANGDLICLDLAGGGGGGGGGGPPPSNCTAPSTSVSCNNATNGGLTCLAACPAGFHVTGGSCSVPGLSALSINGQGIQGNGYFCSCTGSSNAIKQAPGKLSGTANCVCP